jgi:hypothetical protein
VTPHDQRVAAANRVLQAGDRVVASVTKIREATHRVASAYDAGVRGAALEEVILEYRQWLLRTFGLEWFQPGFWGACVRFESEWRANRTPERVEQLLNETAAAWAEAAGRAIITAALWQLALPVIAVQLVFHLGLKTLWYAQYTARGFDDAGLGANLSIARTEVEAWRRALAGPSPPTATTTPTPQPVTTPTPEGAPSPEPFSDEQTARMRVAERSLLAHLEQNRTHYMEAIEALDEVAGPSTTVVLPTAGVQIRARMDDCDAAEPFVTSHRELDLAEKQAQVDRAELERDRLQARLGADPPLLDDPSAQRPAIDVRMIEPVQPGE